MAKEEKTEESNIKLSSEFKKEIKEKSETKWSAIIGLIFAIIFVFGALGVGTYEIFYRSDKVEQTVTAEDKIQSRPENTETQPTPKVETAVPVAPVTPKPATPTYEEYIVLEGDTLSGIATKYDTTSKAIADYNGFTDPEVVLSIGQKIKIPK